MELLYFIFESFWHFAGTIFLLFVVGGVTANILKSFRLFEINNAPRLPQLPNQPQVNQGVFNDLLNLWNKRNKGGDNNQK
jgi:hypothetical protein